MQQAHSGVNIRPFVRFLVVLMAAVFGGVAGGVAGWLLGALYGGNYAVNFEFAGLRGYEATGQIGAIIGFVLIALFCGYVTGRVLLRR
jgi:membrane protein YqaA with SNARE-associated domain